MQVLLSDPIFVISGLSRFVIARLDRAIHYLEASRMSRRPQGILDSRFRGNDLKPFAASPDLEKSL
jgi:hypothetical protein